MADHEECNECGQKLSLEERQRCACTKLVETTSTSRLPYDTVRLPQVDPKEFLLREHAGCKSRSELFLLPHPNKRSEEMRRKICASCKVFVICRETVDYIEGFIPHGTIRPFFDGTGFWAGETPAERRERRKRWSEEGKKKKNPHQ